MTYSTERAGDVWVITLKGEVWGGWDPADSAAAVSRLVSMGGRKFLVDLRRVRAVSSLGIGDLVALQTRLAQAGARLELCAVSARSRRSLEITRVAQLFGIHKDRGDALRAYASSSGIGTSAGLPLQTSSRME